MTRTGDDTSDDTGGDAGGELERCESCGADEPVVFAVHRMYVTPADWDTEGREVTLPDIERWCYSCCTHYPHRLVGSD